MLKVDNFVESTLAVAIDADPGRTTVEVASGSGSKFPSEGNYEISVGNKEIWLITSRAVDVLTGVRAQGGTDPVAHGVGVVVALTVTKGVIEEIQDTFTEEITTTASSATPTPTGGSLRNFFTVTALAEAATFAVPSGSPTNGNRLIIRIKDNEVARTLAYNAIYQALEFALPTTTIAGKDLYLGFIYNNANSKWQLVAVNKEA